MDPDFIDVGSELIKPIGMTDFLLRLLINVLFVIGIIHFLYYRRSRRAILLLPSSRSRLS